MRGAPLLRLIPGLRAPKDKQLGVDMAGQVETAGRNVTQFKPGDEVFGVCHGAFAEYACATEDKLALEARQHVVRGGRSRSRGRNHCPSGTS